MANTVDLALGGVRKVFRNDVLRGPQLALDDLSCVFAAGECTGLLGHNGAGKTTTIRLILGLLRPDQGTITIGGAPLRTEEKRLIGYMPEVNKLAAVLTVSEILDIHLQLFASRPAPHRGMRQQLIAAALAEVGLSEHARKRVGHLSKGMARRLAWAQATVHKPRLLILDEPASGLDPLARRQMLGWIQAAKASGTTILLCTHELSQVMALCDAYHVLRRGKLVASGRLRGAETAAYGLHVSGLNAVSLGQLATAERLPPWARLQQEGVLAELSFTAYEACARWLQALLAKGYVITWSGPDLRAFEDQLLAHFAGES